MNHSQTSRLLGITLLCLLVLPARGQEEWASEKKFAPVPVAVRARLVERLKEFLEYDRAAEYEKKFDLFSKSYLSVAKWTKADYARVMREYATAGKGEKIIEFKISSVENFSLDDAPENMS